MNLEDYLLEIKTRADDRLCDIGICNHFPILLNADFDAVIGQLGATTYNTPHVIIHKPMFKIEVSKGVHPTSTSSYGFAIIPQDFAACERQLRDYNVQLSLSSRRGLRAIAEGISEIAEGIILGKNPACLPRSCGASFDYSKVIYYKP